MLTVDNYHNYSLQLEAKYKKLLVFLLGVLIARLKKTKELNKTNINEIVAQWEKDYFLNIKVYTDNYVKKLKNHANKTIEPKSETKREKQQDITQYTRANMDSLDVTVDYIKQKFNELVIFKNNYSYTDKQLNNFIISIKEVATNKIGLFVVMSTTNNLREFIFDNAESNNYTMYRWRTQRDDRVRPSHADNDDKWFYLATPPPITGHPGHDYNCRCWAIEFR